MDQREVTIDTHSFGDALRNAMRAAPDVIMIGEIRDQETARHAVAYAETGHLCVSTMHANNANQAIERIINSISTRPSASASKTRCTTPTRIPAWRCVASYADQGDCLTRG